ncbi:MAG: prepilin-type N-terminal cleavage/methylation domain-containing protein [Alphaproteobacteria bacterium]|nr:prepilin-type N-terminal cleavage/methylation domain-containing protein [Alphaproteobacteria bacterium]
MERTNLRSRSKEAGFTLVELAIVMIIIGLLITGVLKGQEMIANAQVSSTITQIKSIDAATSTFRDIYNAFPGDMANASTRLRNCAGGNCDDGDGDGRLDVAVGAAVAAANEGTFFFTHMAAADLLSGIDAQNLTFGSSYPSAPVGGGFTAGHSLVGVNGFTAAEMRPAHYLVLTGQTAVVADGTGILSVSQAARIDRKLDDGLIDSGSVIGETAANCRDGSEYAEINQDQLCNIAIRIQG